MYHMTSSISLSSRIIQNTDTVIFVKQTNGRHPKIGFFKARDTDWGEHRLKGEQQHVFLYTNISNSIVSLRLKMLSSR